MHVYVINGMQKFTILKLTLKFLSIITNTMFMCIYTCRKENLIAYNLVVSIYIYIYIFGLLPIGILGATGSKLEGGKVLGAL